MYTISCVTAASIRVLITTKRRRIYYTRRPYLPVQTAWQTKTEVSVVFQRSRANLRFFAGNTQQRVLNPLLLVTQTRTQEKKVPRHTQQNGERIVVSP